MTASQIAEIISLLPTAEDDKRDADVFARTEPALLSLLPQLGAAEGQHADALLARMERMA